MLDSAQMALDDVARELSNLRTEMAEGFRRVNEQLNASKVRDEQLYDLMTFGLEAREALRESIEDRFDRTERKHDEQIQLLNEVVKTIPRR